MKKPKKYERNIKWTDIVTMAIGTTEWKSIYEVWEQAHILIPPHMIYRKTPVRQLRHSGRGYRVATVYSTELNMMSTALRYMMKKGMVERSVPITDRRGGPNLGHYRVRLTKLGIKRLHHSRRYLCNECLNTGITHGTTIVYCGHCHSTRLTFY